MAAEINKMTVNDYDEVRELWERTEGVGLNDADTQQGLDSYLRRNPGLSFVARDGKELIGAVLCGHDGRRGYLHHLAVSEPHRKQGIGGALVERCLSKLKSLGVQKCNIIVYADNDGGAGFWERKGWVEQPSWRIRQRATGDSVAEASPGASKSGTMGVDYDKRIFSEYHRGRAHDELVMQLWRDTIRRCVGDRLVRAVLDLGAGTGRYSSQLAEELDSDVIGVEPSDKMRAVAEAECQDNRVRFVRGSADVIPLDDGAIDMVWMSQVLHHCPDLEAVARELQRIVRQTGLVLIRSNFQDRLKGFARFYDFFPAALKTDEQRHHSIEQVQRIFECNGFRFDQIETVEQLESKSLKDYAERIRLRTYSVFDLISENDFDKGMRELDLAVQAETTPEPVVAKLDLIAFQRQG